MLTINTRSFLRELEWTARVIERKATIPILNNVMLKCDGASGIELTGTDLEVGAIGHVECDGSVPPITFPVQTAIKYLKRVDESEVTLKVEDLKLMIYHGDSECELPGMSVDSYPELPRPTDPPMTITGLRAAIPRVRVAVSKQESRFTLSGALLNCDGASALLVGTDSHRLSHHTLQTSDAWKLRALVPSKALAELEHLKIDSARVSADDAYLYFDIGSGPRRIICRKLTGNFPDYESVMPRDYAHTIMLGTEGLVKAIKRISVMADERSHATTWTVNGNLTVSASVSDAGKAKASVPIISGSDTLANLGEWKTGFKWDYMLEALDLMPEQCGFRFGKPTEASELVTDDWRYVVMPLRVE